MVFFLYPSKKPKAARAGDEGCSAVWGMAAVEKVRALKCEARWKSCEDREVLGITRSLGYRDRHNWPGVSSALCFFLEGTSRAQSKPIWQGPPQNLPAWETNHPRCSKEGLANASSKAAACCTTPGKLRLPRHGAGWSRRWLSHPANCQNRFYMCHSLPTPYS